MGLDTDRGDPNADEFDKVNESDFNESKVLMQNDPIFQEFKETTQKRFEIPPVQNENILIGMQESSMIQDDNEFEQGWESYSDLPQLQKTSSEIVHAQKIKRQNPQTYNYKMVGKRKKSNSGIDKSIRSKEKMKEFTQFGDIDQLAMNNIVQ